LWAIAQEIPDIYGIAGAPEAAYDSLGGLDHVKANSEQAARAVVSIMDEKVHEGKAERGEVDKKIIKAGLAANERIKKEMHQPGGLLGPDIESRLAMHEAKLVADSMALVQRSC